MKQTKEFDWKPRSDGCDRLLACFEEEYISQSNSREMGQYVVVDRSDIFGRTTRIKESYLKREERRFLISQDPYTTAQIRLEWTSPSDYPSPHSCYVRFESLGDIPQILCGIVLNAMTEDITSFLTTIINDEGMIERERSRIADARGYTHLVEGLDVVREYKLILEYVLKTAEKCQLPELDRIRELKDDAMRKLMEKV